MLRASKDSVYPVVLCGGSGARLWPLSRSNAPKQFIKLFDDKSLLQNTCLRAQALGIKNLPIVVSNHAQRFKVAEEMNEINVLKNNNIILEPSAKNTAPAILIAALNAIEKDPHAILLILPSDHYISDLEEFMVAFEQVIDYASSDYIATFGIQPTYPATGYGYLKKGRCLGNRVYEVSKFVEKPNQVLAASYLNAKAYFWNSGIYIISAKTYLNTIQLLQPGLYNYCVKAYKNRQQDLDFLRIDSTIFNKIKPISVDYAVMEKYHKMVMVPLKKTIWSDVGSWKALYDLNKKDRCNNVVLGDVYPINTNDCYIHGKDKLIATIGVENLTIVDTQDALLVCQNNSLQQVKDVFNLLLQQDRKQAIEHAIISRPWGHKKQLIYNELIKVNQVTILPNKEILSQLYYNLFGHWLVLKGQANIEHNHRITKLESQEFITIQPNERYVISATSFKFKDL